MPFVDRQPSWKSVALLALLTPVLYLVTMSFAQVRLTDEALNAAFAQDFIYAPSLLTTRIYGQTVPGFPLYSWCASLCSLFHMPNAFLLRLPALLALTGTAILSGMMARRYHSSFAGMVAAMVVLTSLVSFKIGTLANVELIVGLLLTAAWFSLYHYGWNHGNWTKAWILALSMVFVATFGTGLKAIVIFYLPLLLGGRKTDGIRQIQSPVHMFTAGFYLLLLTLCQLAVPTLPLLPWNALAILGHNSNLGSYMGHLGSMFPKIAFYLFPWTLFAWAPFCLAMRQFERDNRCCHFLRTIVLSNTVMFWLLPGGSPLHLIPVFGPMAVLIGVHSEVVFRRGQEFFGSLLRLATWLILLLSLAGGVFWLCTARFIGIVSFQPLPATPLPVWLTWVCLGFCLISVLAMLLLLLFWNHRSFRTCLLWCIFASRLLFISLWELPQVCWHNRTRLVHGQQLAQSADGHTIRSAMKQDRVNRAYIFLPGKQDITKVLVETFYLRSKLSLVKDISTDLPATGNVYLLTPFQPPAVNLEWTAIRENVNLNERYHTRCETILLHFQDLLKLVCNTYLHTTFQLETNNTDGTQFHRPFVIFRQLATEGIPNASFSNTRIYRGIPAPQKDKQETP